MAGPDLCPDVETLRQFLQERLAEAERADLGQHLLQCANCAAKVEALQNGQQVAAASPPAPAADQRVFTSEPTDRISPASLAAAQAKTQPFAFLAPPRQAGELGWLGPYRILKVLGEGGMGMVFQAEDPALERLVALKVMKPDRASNDVAHQRFLQEAKAAASLQHDHIVTIYQVGEDRGVPFLAMQFLQGESLDDRLKREGKLPVPEVLRIAREAAEGLAAAHKRGLIHRDIKPANIWLEAFSDLTNASTTSGGRVKILDFGLARLVGDNAHHLTQTGMVVGTPDYMAPEQARNQALDGRCDLFSLGSVMYHMCTGQKPFLGEDAMAKLLALTLEEPTPIRFLNAEVPRELAEFIMALLAKNPADRPQSAQAVVDSLTIIERSRAGTDAWTALGSDELRVQRHAYSGPDSGMPPGSSSRRRRVRPTPTSQKSGVDRPAPRREEQPTAPVPPSPDVSPARSSVPSQGAGRPAATAKLQEFGLTPCGDSVAAAQAIRLEPAARSAGQAVSTLVRPAATASTVTKTSSLEAGCPRCGSKRYSPVGQGWCLSCGYYPTLAEEAVQKPRPGKASAWVAALGAGILVVLVITGVCHVAFPRYTVAWTRWIWVQMIAGLAAALASQVWAYYIVLPYRGDYRGYMPFNPIYIWVSAYQMLPKTQRAFCLGAWGLSAALAAGYVVGDASYWWRGRSMNLPLPSASLPKGDDKVATAPETTQETKPTPLSARCVVIGYLSEEEATISGVVLAVRRDGAWHYAGVSHRITATENNDKVAGRLAALVRARPVLKGLNLKATWVEARIFCEVEYAQADVNGVFVDPIVTKWEP